MIRIVYALCIDRIVYQYFDGNSRFPVKDGAHCIVLDTGPEVIQGSTRMKAGTAQQPTLNAMSTTIAIKLGRVYDNMMSYMGVTFNAKLKESAISFLMNEFAVSRDDALRTLEKSDYKLWAAIDRLKAGRSDEGSSKSAEN